MAKTWFISRQRGLDGWDVHAMGTMDFAENGQRTVFSLTLLTATRDGLPVPYHAHIYI